VGAGIAILIAGTVMTVAGVAIGTNFRDAGVRVATFGGAITFMSDGGHTLRHRQRTWRVWGALLALIGIGWMVGGVALVT
jgi:hypothetical protein